MKAVLQENCLMQMTMLKTCTWMFQTSLNYRDIEAKHQIKFDRIALTESEFTEMYKWQK